jgi:hypothetical protein
MKCLPPKKPTLFGYWTKNLNNTHPLLHGEGRWVGVKLNKTCVSMVNVSRVYIMKYF